MIAIVGGLILVTAVVVVALWWAGTAGLNGDKLVAARLDALRTGLSIGLGGGGALALYLSWRRQRAAEIALAQAAIALAQKDRDQDHTEADSRERRITDLYTKAVEQLGSDKAPVRLGGLYALERLAQDNPHQRQTIVNVLCAYLRMPYTIPGKSPGDDAETSILDVYRERVQEREVRVTAQRILALNLRCVDNRRNPIDTFWPGIDIDLTGAVLIDLDFMGVSARTVRFGDARFSGTAAFTDSSFGDFVEFGDAQFSDIAWFERVKFSGYAGFGSTTFKRMATFESSRFLSFAYFKGTHFLHRAKFSQVQFGNLTMFYEAEFLELAEFDQVVFNSAPFFDGARFDSRLPEVIKEFLRPDDDVAAPPEEE
ncbi:pentapeptide repeat-containing protein [Lentzea sp. NPDC034063]|uniref:pentapeptide repeat-containing protein n=1 Tax=unclassified Lentzea TaxID=2643253 RepID=UPI00340699ED